MKGVELLGILKNLDLSFFRTQDAAQLGGCSVVNASHHLRRLEKEGQIIWLKKGLWGFREKIQRWALPAILTAPVPSYVSLYSALFFHGMIEQIPDTIYAITAGRTYQTTTPLGTVSFHHCSLSFVTGFTFDSQTHVAMASPEKALVDTLYLQSSRSPFFHALPELEFSPGFSLSQAEEFIKQIPHLSKRASTLSRLNKLYQLER